MKRVHILLAPLLLFMAFFPVNHAVAQRNVPSTDTLRLWIATAPMLAFPLSALDTFPTVEIGDLPISNHEGEIKNTAKGMQGFLVKQILSQLTLPIEKPRFLNEYYFVFVASDGYKVTFSWNEIFNTEVGNHLFIVTQQDGKKLREMENRILVVCTTDFLTGRRHIKGLQRIVGMRVE
jgi:hypothetical protein